MFLATVFGQGSTLGRGHNGPGQARAGGMGGCGVENREKLDIFEFFGNGSKGSGMHGHELGK